MVEGVVVVVERLVAVAALLEGEAREVAPEAQEAVFLLVVLDVLLHYREAARLDLGAGRVRQGQIVDDVDGVDHQLLVARTLVGARAVGEEVFAEVGRGAAREIEDVDGLVGLAQIARAGLPVVHALEDGAAVEQQERVVADEGGHVVLRGDAELDVEGRDGLFRRMAVEGVQRRGDAALVARAPEESRARGRRGEDHREAALPQREGVHGGQLRMMALVNSTLCCQSTALVDTSMSCMNMKYWTRRSPKARSSAVKTLPVT